MMCFHGDDHSAAVTLCSVRTVCVWTDEGLGFMLLMRAHTLDDPQRTGHLHLILRSTGLSNIKKMHSTLNGSTK